MWYITKNADERTLLYAAETFEQFEWLLQLFEQLENEENDTWWDKLANELGSTMKPTIRLAQENIMMIRI